MEQLVQLFYQHLNMTEESNSNAPFCSGTRQGKEEEEEDHVYAGQSLLSRTTICIYPTPRPPPHCPPGLI